MSNTRNPRRAMRAKRLWLATTALRGAAAGAVGAIVTWLLDRIP